MYNELVWKHKIEDRFLCTVIRLSDNTGEIKIIDEKRHIILLEQEVDLADCGAISKKDIACWENLAKEAIESE